MREAGINTDHLNVGCCLEWEPRKLTNPHGDTFAKEAVFKVAHQVRN
jgi:hypothetical protein